jgi:hypothetical protein
VKLYYASPIANLDSILRTGIRPRGTDEGHWGSASVRNDLVYLGRWFGPAYALHYSRHFGGNGLIVEVNLPEPDVFVSLLPDENLVGVDHPGDPHVLERIADYARNLEHHRSDWRRSYETIGNVAFEGRIDPDRLTRYCTVDFQERSTLAHHWLEASFEFSEGRAIAAALTSWLFGDSDLLPVLPSKNELLRRQESGNRNGISVFTVDQSSEVESSNTLRRKVLKVSKRPKGKGTSATKKKKATKSSKSLKKKPKPSNATAKSNVRKTKKKYKKTTATGAKGKKKRRRR